MSNSVGTKSVTPVLLLFLSECRVNFLCINTAKEVHLSPLCAVCGDAFPLNGKRKTYGSDFDMVNPRYALDTNLLTMIVVAIVFFPDKTR